MNSSRIVSYAHAENLCTGSLGDDNYSNCILNNLKFLPYHQDTQEALTVSNSGLSTTGIIPYLAGKTYVSPKPVAISDTSVRMLMKNDYGQISFRCLDVAAKPMLPLMDLTDLGLEDRPLVVNSRVSLPISSSTEYLCGGSKGYLSGIPVKCVDDCNPTNTDCKYEALLYNYKNYTVKLNNQYQTILSNCDVIANVISSSGNYDKLLELADEANDSIVLILQVYDVWKSIYSDLLTLSSSGDYYGLIKDIYTTVDATVSTKSVISNSTGLLNTNVISVIRTRVSEHEDWTTFQFYDALDDVASYMADYRKTDNYIEIQNSLSIALKFLNCFSYVPKVDSTTDDLYYSLLAEEPENLIFEQYNLSNIIMTKIRQLYTLSNLPDLIEEIKAKVLIYDLYDSYSSLIPGIRGKINTSTMSDKEALLDLIDSYIDTKRLFNDVLVFIQGLTDQITEDDLDTFYEDHGNENLVNLSVTYAKLQTVLGLIDSGVTEVNLGASFKDSGRYYFANVAYIIGFGLLTKIKSIKIDNAIYKVDSITDEQGHVIDVINASGCTKYRLKFKLFPGVANNSTLQDLEMYIYPGTPDQPYCPTINKYHNYNACTYSGLFTKLVAGTSGESPEMSLYMFKGYSPMQNTVDEIISLGSTDLNAIDLARPDLDKDSPDTFMQKEIVGLTNSSSLIASNVITSKDLKFYLKSTLIGTEEPVETHNETTTQGLNVPEANNYPNMAIIEFVDMPLGSSFRVPKIELLVESTDSVVS